MCTAWSGLGSSSRIENAATVATRKPPRKTSFWRGRPSESGYEAQSGATSSGANLVQAASAEKTPRANAEVTSQKPQISKSGGSASFVFEFDTYWVNGQAAHANASVTASRAPPTRKPIKASPTMQRTSKITAAKCDAG